MMSKMADEIARLRYFALEDSLIERGWKSFEVDWPRWLVSVGP